MNRQPQLCAVELVRLNSVPVPDSAGVIALIGQAAVQERGIKTIVVRGYQRFRACFLMYVIGIFIIVFTIMILFKLRSMYHRSKVLHTRAEKEANRFNQANLTSAGMLLSSLLFITIPSVGVGFLEMIGYSIFRRLGPFYLVGLLCAGTCNSIVYVMLNRDMRGFLKSFFSSNSTSSTNLFQSSANK
ncbi:hypothetical protein ANCCEY_05177 [Ancylostoma ceylanicum]|uniref:Uncharacterized protein n=1 Tax=Ancylostoma ceylanicum TaxID=53326 RepID=A0A0D6LV69_9BILA|nr:hypothetical protein ANCCEY_05177 [Ancylostoma ceylanicum]